MISGSIALAANTFHTFSDIDHLDWVMAAGIIGFIGKELVARIASGWPSDRVGAELGQGRTRVTGP
jgi:hypothetical protein